MGWIIEDVDIEGMPPFFKWFFKIFPLLWILGVLLSIVLAALVIAALAKYLGILG